MPTNQKIAAPFITIAFDSSGVPIYRHLYQTIRRAILSGALAAGFRVAEWLSGGKYLEIEDLAAKDGKRSKGYGGALFDWIVKYVRQENCNQTKLASHVTRFAAHRFYLNKRMIIEAHYFSLALK